MKVEITSNIKEVIDSMKASVAHIRSKTKLTVFNALTILEAEIMQNIRSRSGLKVRSGALLNSVPATKGVTEESDGSVSGTIGSQGVPYAAIHEFGGTTRPHDIYPRNKKSLRFMGSQGETFARFVKHPGSKIPARPFIRPALAAKQQEILETFGIMIEAAFKDK